MTKGTGAVNLGTNPNDVCCGQWESRNTNKFKCRWDRPQSRGVLTLKRKQKKSKTLKINKLFFHSTSCCKKTKTNKNYFSF